MLTHYGIAFFGSILWAAIMFSISKNITDNDDKEFDYGKYCKKNIDNWIVTTLCAPVLVWFLPDIINILNERTEWKLNFYEFYYLGAGVLVEIFYIGVAMLFKWKEKFIPSAHKEK